MLRRALRAGLALTGLAMALSVQPASAQLTSMYATCVGAGGSCDLMDFVLNASGPSDLYVEHVNIFGLDGLWKFGNVQSVWSNGSLASWVQSSAYDALTLTISNGPPFDPTPIRTRVGMTQHGDASQFTAMAYTTDGYEDQDGSAGFFSTSGTVTADPGGSATTTPEPETLLLLGTGLVGLVGVAGRRKKGLVENEDDAAA